MTSIVDLINSEDKTQATHDVHEILSNLVFNYLDNYVPADETVREEVDEAVVPGSVKKDKKGHVLSFKTVPDKKSAVIPGSVKKDDKGNVLSFKTEEVKDLDLMTMEELVLIDLEQLDELNKSTLVNYVTKKYSTATNNGQKPYANIDAKDKTNMSKAFNKHIKKEYTPDELAAKKKSQDAYIAADGEKHGGKY